MNTQGTYGAREPSTFNSALGPTPARAFGIDAAPTSRDRLAALIAHGGTFVAWMLAPLVVYALSRNESRYAEFHALQSLLWSLLGTVVAAATCGLAIPVFMVFHAIAAYKTMSGEHFEYPFVAKIARGLMT